MEEFKKALETARRIKKEQEEQEDKRAAAEKAVAVAVRAADDARVAAVIDPSPAAAKMAAEAAAKVDKVLEARDRLEARGADLAKAAAVVLRDLSRLAKEEAERSKAAAFAAAAKRLEEARPALERAAMDAGILWAAAGDGPLDSDRIPDALLKYSGLDFPALRRALFAEWDGLMAAANSYNQSIYEVSNED